jgi:hypothetical protein
MLQFLNEQHLVDIVACEPIWCRDDDPIKGASPDLVAQAIESGTTQAGSTVAVIAKNVLITPLPSLSLILLAQTVELLLDCLGQSLALGRDPHIHGNFHLCSPGGTILLASASGSLYSTGQETGSSGPIGTERRSAQRCDGAPSTAVSSCVSS